MAKPKEDEDYSETNIEEEYSLENDEVSSNENINSAISAEDFDPERILYDIKKTMMGFDKRGAKWVRVTEPIARSDFINLYVNSLRSLLNFHNMFSVTTGEEAAFNMMEALKEITYAAVDYGIAEEHIETLVNMYDTLKGTFYGIIIEGRGTENVKQVLGSFYKDIRDATTQKKENGLINWDYANKYLK